MVFFLVALHLLGCASGTKLTNMRVDEDTKNFIISTDNKVEVLAKGGMSLGTISNVEDSIIQTAEKLVLHTASIASVETGMESSKTSLKGAEGEIAALNELVANLAAAAKDSDEELRQYQVELAAAVKGLTKTAGELTTAQQQVANLEAEVEGSCGSACRAGLYISAPCTDDEKHVCSACADGTFSLGGFPHTCTPHATCPGGTYLKSAGTAVADTGCAACEDGKTFSLKENEEECGECTAECDDGFVVATKCTTTSDITCKPAYTAFWATMEADCDVESMSGAYVIGGKDASTKWKVDPNKFASMGSFQVGAAFDVETGIYTVPKDGLYSVAAMIRIDKVSPQGRQMKMHININEQNDNGNSRAVADIDSSMPARYTTMKVTSTFNLKTGDTLSVMMYIWDGASFRIQYESGWGVALVDDKAAGNNPQGCSYRPVSHYYTDYNSAMQFEEPCETYEAEKKASLYGSYTLGGLNLGNSNYIIPEDGIYRIGLNIRHDAGTGSSIRTIMVLNDNSNSFCCAGLGLLDTKTSATASMQNVGGLVTLKKGDKVTIGKKHWSGGIWISDWSVFSAVKIGDTKRVGFAARLADGYDAGHQNKHVGWNKLTGFTTEPLAATEFIRMFDNSDGGFDGTVFKAPVKGVYAVEGSVRFDNAAGHYFRLVIAKNGDMDLINDNDMGDTVNGYLRSGMAAIRADGPSSPYSLSVSGFMLLNKGDNIGIYTYGTHQFGIHLDTGWSAALMHEL